VIIKPLVVHMKKIVPGTMMALALVVVPVYAQNAGSLTPGAVQQQQNQTQRYYGQQKELQQGNKPLKPGEAIINKAKSATGKLPSKGGPRFLLRKVETNPSAILTSANVRQITAPYLGKKVTVGDLLKMVAVFSELYKRSSS
jgi:hemolysin activation/secretion protein